MRIVRIMAVAVALSSGFAGCHERKPPPSIDALSAALERSAANTLTAPSLADEQIIVPAMAGQSGAQTAEIERVFAAAGGTAVSSVTADGRISILAQVPEINVGPLKAALRHEPAVMQKGPPTPTRMIEVLIDTTPASHTP